jgi:hypothetical protein
MQAAAIIVTFLSLYAAFFSFCRVAAQSETRAGRYRTRSSRTRVGSAQLGVERGR